MTRLPDGQWLTSLLCPYNQTVLFKLYLGDKVGMLGVSTFMTDGQDRLTIYPSFYPSPNPVFNTQPVHSSILGNERKLSISLPPSYYENTFKRYDLLLMQDGQNLFNVSDSEYGQIWDIKPTLDELMLSGSIRELIVVGIWNTKQRCDEYTNTYDPELGCGGKADLYLRFIREEMVPWV